MNRAITIKCIFIALIAITICGCDAPQQPQQLQASNSQTDRIASITLAPSKTKHITAAIRPLGSVPYDGFALPIVSPNGKSAATQHGSPPSWSTVLAQANSSGLGNTSISIFELGWDSSEASLFKQINKPAMLGRSCDYNGFLIESPRNDGSRWIGYVSWNTGIISWLVADEQVNAFAALGSKKQLAWSRRSIDGEHFDLVVKINDLEWSIISQGEDWLMPQWSGHANGLFVFRLEKGMLQATHLDASNSSAADKSIKHLKLMSQATIRDAFQCLAATISTISSNNTTIEHLVFFHPRSLRLALWQPLSRSSDASFLLAEHTTAGLIHSNTQALLTDAHGLMLQNLINPNDRRRLVPGIQIPRPIESASWPYVLAAPTEGVVDLTAMRLLELDD